MSGFKRYIFETESREASTPSIASTTCSTLVIDSPDDAARAFVLHHPSVPDRTRRTLSISPSLTA